LCIGIAVAVSAQQDPKQLLNQIRQKVGSSISHLPRYMCMETVDRINLLPDKFAHGPKEKLCLDILATSEFKDKRQVFSTDRLRLDVAVSNNSEMYSWVGEEKFGDQGLGERVKHGATSTGAFSSYLQSIFVGDGARFNFKGESQRNGRQALEYSFSVPLSESRYTVSNKNISRLTGYNGTFWVDAQTLDLLKLEINTDPLPPELNICQATATLEYAQVRMSNVDFLLPLIANMRFVNADGSESHNRTSFSSCHQFLGESNLILEDQSAAFAPVSDVQSPRPQWSLEAFKLRSLWRSPSIHGREQREIPSQGG
jgi:hypothetical protein